MLSKLNRKKPQPSSKNCNYNDGDDDNNNNDDDNNRKNKKIIIICRSHVF